MRQRHQQTALSARHMVRKAYGKSRNFLTPHLIRLGKIRRDMAYELSSGSGIGPGSRLFGVSVVQMLPDGSVTRRTDLSKSYPSLAEAEAYIQKLRT